MRGVAGDESTGHRSPSEAPAVRPLRTWPKSAMVDHRRADAFPPPLASSRGGRAHPTAHDETGSRWNSRLSPLSQGTPDPRPAHRPRASIPAGEM